ncbi:MAG: hypothetical protein ACOX3L_07605 [Lutisporaceae bacterium]
MKDNSNTISVEEAAKGLKVKPTDIIKWITEGKIKAIKQADYTFKIPIEEYQRYGKSFPNELRLKIGEYLWNAQLRLIPKVQEEVRERFSSNSQLVLDRDEIAVNVIETIHRKHEPEFDLFDDKRGTVAAFILYSRVISLLHSIILLLRGGIPSESFILFRPLWEAIQLAEYFLISEASNENKKEIRRWFEHEETPPARDVRYYLSKKIGLPLKILQELNHRYSKPVHHTYKVIMESYRGVSMSGFLGDYSQGFGFDYHQSRIMRDIITLIEAFENLLLSALQGFNMCFSPILAEDEVENLREQIEFYMLDPNKRLEKIFK